MTLPDQVLGQGTLLQVDRGSGYATIAHLTEIGEFRPERDDVEVTTHQSTAGWRQFRGGLVDPGELDFTGVWTADASQTALMDDLLAGVDVDNVYPYRIVLPRGLGTFTCDGYLRNVGINPQMEGRLEFSGALKWTGAAEFAVTESAGLTTPFFSVNNSGVIVPAPAQDTVDYVVSFATGVTSFTITPTAAAGVIRVNGAVVASGAASGAIALGAAGSVTTAIVTVKETDEVAKEYTIRAVRAAS